MIKDSDPKAVLLRKYSMKNVTNKREAKLPLEAVQTKTQRGVESIKSHTLQVGTQVIIIAAGRAVISPVFQVGCGCLLNTSYMCLYINGRSNDLVDNGSTSYP